MSDWRPINELTLGDLHNRLTVRVGDGGLVTGRLVSIDATHEVKRSVGITAERTTDTRSVELQLNKVKFTAKKNAEFIRHQEGA